MPLRLLHGHKLKPTFASASFGRGWWNGALLAVSVLAYFPTLLGGTLLTQADKTSMKFQLDSMGSGILKGGGRFSFDEYKSLDGVIVQRRVETYTTSGKAGAKVANILNHAIKVIERGPKRPHEGNGAGERWEVSFRQRRGEKPIFLVFWQDGADVYILQSASLGHVRAFEDWIYPEGERK